MKMQTQISKILMADSHKAKKLFDLCEKIGEGIHDKLHIIDNSRFSDEKKEYRIYHGDGYCFDIIKEKIELAEDESNHSSIGGYEYYFNEGIHSGFTEISVEEAIKLFKAV